MSSLVSSVPSTGSLYAWINLLIGSMNVSLACSFKPSADIMYFTNADARLEIFSHSPGFDFAQFNCLSKSDKSVLTGM